MISEAWPFFTEKMVEFEYSEENLERMEVGDCGWDFDSCGGGCYQAL